VKFESSVIFASEFGKPKIGAEYTEMAVLSLQSFSENLKLF
jgi:hypothetical protein